MNYYKIKDKLSNSTFKRYMKCRAKAYAEDTGEIETEIGDGMIAGTYIDTMLFEPEKLPEIQEQYAGNLFKKDGGLYAKFANLDQIVENIKNDKIFMEALNGETQKEAFFDIDGIPWKGKLDVLRDKSIVDMKTAASLTRWEYSPRFGCRVPFYLALGYDIQGSVYRHAFERERFVLAVASTGISMAKQIIELPKEMLDNAFEYVRSYQERVWDWMQGKDIDFCTDPDCKYCGPRRATPYIIAETIYKGEDENF